MRDRSSPFGKGLARSCLVSRRGKLPHSGTPHTESLDFACRSVQPNTQPSFLSLCHLPQRGHTVWHDEYSVEKIEKLLKAQPTIATAAAIKRRVTERALAGLAPYHRAKNSVGDAILIEVYAELVGGRLSKRKRFAFAIRFVACP
jgi:hypothetical protein